MKPFPFQQATVDAAVARLGGRGPRRFLVADEVGLGKTVVAREVIRKLSGGGSKRFTVYYVTSNTKVSDQNAKRLVDFLGSASKSAVSRVDRLGLFPLEKPARALRLHPLAPITSFAPLAARPQTGKAGERALISWLLERCYPGILEALPKGLLQQRSKSGWQVAIDRARPLAMKRPEEVCRRLSEKARLDIRLRRTQAHRRSAPSSAPSGSRSLRVYADPSLKHAFWRARRISSSSMNSSATVICLRRATKDRLVRALLEGENGRRPAMLLLSATPYRLFSESWEITVGAQPHEELFGIVEFLGGRAARSETERLFHRFGAILRRIAETSDQPP